MQPTELTALFDDVLEADQVPETGGIIQPGLTRQIKRLGLSLDWDADTAAWAAARQLDALWLHRLPAAGAAFPDDLTVICHHAAFDRRFGLAANPTLHHELGAATSTTLSDRPALTIIRLALPILQTELADVLRTRYDGIERTYGYGTRLTIIALADAMQAELLAAASSAGAELYVTGQWRPTAEAVAEELGLSVITIGHGPVERRGLHDLAVLLQPALNSTKLSVNT